MSKELPPADPLATVEELVERGAASQREFITPACVLVLTYVVFWPAALVAHFLLLREASRVSKATGRNAPGHGCLQLLFAMILVPVATLVLLVMLLTGSFAAAASNAAKSASAQPESFSAAAFRDPDPPIIEVIPAEESEPSEPEPIATPAEDTEAAPAAIESYVGRSLITIGAVDVFDKGPVDDTRKSVRLEAPLGIFVLRQVEHDGTLWIDGLFSRWQGDSFPGWVSAESVNEHGAEETTRAEMTSFLPTSEASSRSGGK